MSLKLKLYTLEKVNYLLQSTHLNTDSADTDDTAAMGASAGAAGVTDRDLAQANWSSSDDDCSMVEEDSVIRQSRPTRIHVAAASNTMDTVMGMTKVGDLIRSDKNWNTLILHYCRKSRSRFPAGSRATCLPHVSDQV